MRNIAVNTLGYSGTVTLSQCIGAKKFKIAQVHNSGGNPLFNFLADCLADSYDTAKVNRPAKIMLLKCTEEVDADGKITSMSLEKASPGFIGLLSKPEKIYDEAKGIVRYSFMISRDILQDTEFNSIGLYPNAATDTDLYNYAAFCKVDISKSEVSVSSVLIVDWELSISNVNS